LVVADRAYGTLNGMKHCLNRGTRLRTDCFAVYDENGNKVDSAGGFEDLKRGESSEAAVFAVLPYTPIQTARPASLKISR
jgi:hypothetical protein